MQNELVALAARAQLTPAQAVALPTVISRMAVAASISERALVAQATYRNEALRDYVAKICREVTA